MTEASEIYIPINQEAIDALIERNASLVKGLTEETKKGIISELTEGMIKGEGIDQLVARISKYVDSSPGNGQSRAERIARTEVMYALNRGALSRYGRDGIQKVAWLAGPDDRCCPTCIDNDGKRFDISEAPGLPIHPNCLLPETECITAGDVVSGLRAWYDGPVFEVTTSGGCKITVTPNHMFLTSHGFCAAQFLREGDDIINCSGFERIVSENPDDYQAPTRIEDIFNSLIESSGGSPSGVPIASEDLHGDGRFTNGKIDIIFSNRFLGTDVETAFQKHFGGGHFDPTSKPEIPFFSTSPLYEFLFSAGNAADGRMSCSRQSDPLFRARGSHPGIHSFAPVPGCDSVLLQDSNDNIPGNPGGTSNGFNGLTSVEPGNNGSTVKISDKPPVYDGNVVRSENPGNGFIPAPEFNTNFLNAYPGLVEIDNVSDISIRKYSGHVYDLQTVSTLYIGSLILLSNCRCTWVPVIE